MVNSYSRINIENENERISYKRIRSSNEKLTYCSLIDLKRVMINPDLKAIIACDSAEKLEYARRLIEKEDMRRVEVTPTVHYNDEISLKAEFELTSIVREGTVTQPPTIGNRSVSSSIRLRDGETTLIAGLIKTQERHSRSGIPGISQLPVLGHIFASNQDGDDQTDIVLTMTPHIVRIAEIGEEERRAIWMGTAKTMRISEEPPP